MTSCSFAGHREVYQAGIDEQIKQTIEKILTVDTDFVFYTGAMGDFDSKCSAAVRAAKHQHPHLNIRLVLVMPYMSNKLNTDKEFYETAYDDIIIPSELAETHYKSAIGKRNRWIVDRTDYLIAFVYRDFGGALNTVRYAQKQGKKIINLASNADLHI